MSTRSFMSPNTLALSPSRQNLWRLILIRLLVLLAQSVSVLAAYLSGWFPLPWGPLLLALGGSALVSILTLLRLGRGWPVTSLEYGLQLLFDMFIHSVLLYYSGGPTNPFVSYYLVPLTIAAATLPWFFTAVLAVVAVTSYSALLVWYEPLTAFDIPLGGGLVSLHVIGMWLNFAMSAGLISLFVVRMADALRQQPGVLEVERGGAILKVSLDTNTTAADIASNKYDLSINRYKDVVYEEEQYEDPKVILGKLMALENDIMADLKELEGML